MVTTDISQLSPECNTWKSNLRTFRQEFTHFKDRLQEIASHQTSRNILLDIEHYDNQFQIQLFNIHDLKQDIKEHERIAVWELSSSKGISDAVWSKHEELYQKYLQLEHTLQELKKAFEGFMQHIRM